MLDQELGEKTGIQPAGIQEGIVSRVLSGDPEVQRGVSHRETEIDQQGALARLLGQSYRKIARNSRDTGATLGAEKYAQPSASLFRGASCRIEGGRGPNESLGYGALVEGQGEILTSARTHATDHQVPIGRRRKDHHDRRVLGADALH